MPGTAIKPTITLGPATTNTRNCQICTPVGPNEDDCHKMTSCTPKVAQVTNTMGSSSVHVGPLTGTALYTAVSNALVSACPPATQTTSATECMGTEPVQIKDIAFKEGDGTLGKGEIAVLIDHGFYTDTKSQRGEFLPKLYTRLHG